MNKLLFGLSIIMVLIENIFRIMRGFIPGLILASIFLVPNIAIGYGTMGLIIVTMLGGIIYEFDLIDKLRGED
jgi:hypothetical protein